LDGVKETGKKISPVSTTPVKVFFRPIFFTGVKHTNKKCLLVTTDVSAVVGVPVVACILAVVVAIVP